MILVSDILLLMNIMLQLILVKNGNVLALLVSESCMWLFADCYRDGNISLSSDKKKETYLTLTSK